MTRRIIPGAPDSLMGPGQTTGVVAFTLAEK